jgi:hypothetical protein
MRLECRGLGVSRPFAKMPPPAARSKTHDVFASGKARQTSGESRISVKIRSFPESIAELLANWQFV